MADAAGYIAGLLQAYLTETDPVKKAAWWRTYLSVVRSTPAVELTWESANRAVWTVAQKSAPRLASQEYIARLLQTFGKIAVGEVGSAEAGGAVLARGAGGTILRALTGWPCLVAVAVMSIGCTSQDQKDMAQADQQSSHLYQQYLVRYAAWANRRLGENPNANIEEPRSYGDFMQNQNQFRIPSLAG